MNTLTRYRNLVRNIQNWPLYFTRKLKKGFHTLQFITRGNRVKLQVPSKALYLVFKEIFVTDFYNINRLIASIPSNPVIVDIGANVGYFNMLLFSKLKDATVYAYEPIKTNYDLFNKNISLNPSLQQHIHLFNKAVTGTPQDHVELFLETDTGNSVIASVYNDFDSQNKYTLKVPAISLEQIISQQPGKIDLLKVDCEGSEYPIIYETPKPLWNRVDKIVIEVHNLDDDKRNVEYLKKFLQEMNYRVETAPAHTNCYWLSAAKETYN